MARALVLDSLPEEQQEYVEFLTFLGFQVDVGRSYVEAKSYLEKRRYALLLLDPYLTYAYDGEQLLDWADSNDVPFAVVIINNLVESGVMRGIVACRKRMVLTMKARDFQERKSEIAAMVIKHNLSRDGSIFEPERIVRDVPGLRDILVVLFAIICLAGVTLVSGWAVDRLFGNWYMTLLMSTLCALLVVLGMRALFGKQVREAVEILKSILPREPSGPAGK